MFAEKIDNDFPCVICGKVLSNNSVFPEKLPCRFEGDNLEYKNNETFFKKKRSTKKQRKVQKFMLYHLKTINEKILMT